MEKYYYANGKKIPLTQESHVFAVRYKAGKDSRTSNLSRKASRLLREDAQHIGFIAAHNLQIYRLNFIENNSLQTSSPSQKTNKIVKDIVGLSKEKAVDFALLAFNRNPNLLAEKVEDLMFVDRQFIVQFKSTVQQKQIQTFNQQHEVKIINLVNYSPNTFVLEAPQVEGNQGVVALANLYYESGMVEFSHPNFIRRRQLRDNKNMRTVMSNSNERSRSLYLAQQWHLDTTDTKNAWSITKGSRDIKIAILDDGVDTQHQEFVGKVAAQFDFASNNADGRPNFSYDNHGTACAGVAIAAGIKASGAAPNCSLIAVRYPDFLGVIEEANMFKWSADQGADIISCSWGPADGTGAFDPLPDNVRAAIRYCVQEGRNGKGIPVFWAAGNGNESVSNDGYAANPDVIAVAASTSQEKRAYYSDYGKEIFICAPSSGDFSIGEKSIFTTDRTGMNGYNPDAATGQGHPSTDFDYTDDFGGTSSAAPLVAGIAGLILSSHPDLKVSELKQILKETADKIDTQNGNYNADGHSHLYGYGRINAHKAVVKAKALAGGNTSSGGQTNPPTPNALSITAPISAERDGAAPIFQIGKGGRQYYAVEVATSAALLNSASTQRTSSNFYGSWQQGLVEVTPYELPEMVWSQLKSANHLYYRLHVANDGNWADYGVSLANTEVNNAPSLAIVNQNTNTPTTSLITFPSGAQFSAVTQPSGIIDYSDSVANGAVALIEVKNRLNEQLSNHFQVREFAARDGADYARISVDLVAGLQRMRNRVGAPISINSAYRYIAYNQQVGGVSSSQHIAGRAVDIRTSAIRPLELARIAIEELGCDIGIGLGANSIHVDLRGRLTTWKYDGAELSKTEFRAWVENVCQELANNRSRQQRLASQKPSIVATEIYETTAEAPAFYIHSSTSTFFAVEVTTNLELFANGQEHHRTAQNFYGSWSDEGLKASKGDSVYQLPKQIWEQFKNARRVYYRILTSNTKSEWSNVQSSISATNYLDSPWIDLMPNQILASKNKRPIRALDMAETRQEESFWKKNRRPKV